MTEEYVSLKEIAKVLRVDRSNARKIILNQGFAPIRIRTEESKNQLTLALTKEEAQELYSMREKAGFNPSKQIAVNTENGKGEFYIIQLIPELDPLRLKFGFASNSQSRLQAHRTTAPTCEILKTWPCKKIWEQPAIDSITRNNCKKIGGEVFQVSDLEKIVEKANQFFDIMPKI